MAGLCLSDGDGEESRGLQDAANLGNTVLHTFLRAHNAQVGLIDVHDVKSHYVMKIAVWKCGHANGSRFQVVCIRTRPFLSVS